VFTHPLLVRPLKCNTNHADPVNYGMSETPMGVDSDAWHECLIASWSGERHRLILAKQHLSYILHEYAGFGDPASPSSNIERIAIPGRCASDTDTEWSMELGIMLYSLPTFQYAFG